MTATRDAALGPSTTAQEPPHLAPLVLGTAQIGMPYGKFQFARPPTDAECDALLDLAWEGGIRTFDTARVYGNAEERLGDWAHRRGRDIRVITKVPPAPEAFATGTDATAFVAAALAASRAALRRDHVDVYLVHRVADLGNPFIVEALRGLVASGAIGGFGASIYEPEEAFRALAVDGLSDIEAPMSAVDARFRTSGALLAACTRVARVWARSVFLQGALLSAPESLPPHLAALEGAVRRLRHHAERHGVAVHDLLIELVARQTGIAGILVGAQNRHQLQGILDRRSVPGAVLADLDDLALDLPAAVIDPRRWPPRG